MIELIEIVKIRENPDNPRTITADKFNKLVKSLKSFPKMLNLRPIIINDEMVALGGNMRLRAAKRAGLTHVPVIKASDLSPEEQKEFIIKDNVGFGDWDFDALSSDWEADQLQEWGLDIPGFMTDEVVDDEFETPPLDEIKTDIVLGDVIEIGSHRLVCGDSTNPDHVKSVLNSAEPYLMITDPPYGVEYDANWRNESERKKGKKIGGRAIGKVENDDRIDWSDTFSLSPAKVAYIYHAGKFSNQVAESLIKNEYLIRSQIIWTKNNFAIGRGDYHWKHEPCWYAVKNGYKSQWCGDRKQTTIWEIDKPQKSETGHSTQKPVECMGRPMKNHEGDVYDPFLGSGTTMVAAHQLGRICYGIEINPKYCQIVIDRMKKLDETVIIKINGQ